MKKNLKPETNLSLEEATLKYGPPPKDKSQLKERPDLSKLKEDEEDVE